MKIISDLDSFLLERAKLQEKEKIAFIPTMGNLHNGHISLIRDAKKIAGKIIVSIFINPMQFSGNEDYETYPRTKESDENILKEEGVDFLFSPSSEIIYSNTIDDHTKLEIPSLGNLLCGASRPKHFSGVATIVCKLFNIVRPDVAFFGKKDFQQLVIIKKMVEDLAIPVEIRATETVREEDGLAISSRNQYLTNNQRIIAPILYKQLSILASKLRHDFQNLAPLKNEFIDLLNNKGFFIEYIELVNTKNLATVSKRVDNENYIIVTAGLLGKTRLIDNIEIK